ncbi:MAG: inner membrane protein [Pseudoalteromonas tetraodonis]|jgi:inner membrane protein
MDPISQGALGAVAGALCADRTNIRKATLVSWAAGMLADADIFISSASDPLLNIEYHRHFSHSLLFIPIGALVCAGFFWLITRKRWQLPFRTLYLFSFAGYATAGLLDACTSYGTRLLWPFSDARVAWNIISIIDPIFTLTLLATIAVGVIKKRPAWLRAGLAFACCYLFLGVVQRERTSSLQSILARQRGHHAMEQATVKPSIGNLILWRSIYRDGDRFYVDAIRTGVFGKAIYYEGVSVPVLTLEGLRDGLPADSALAQDLDRFDHFSDNFLARHPDDPEVISDLRYAALPQSIQPLWGIRVDRKQPDKHVPFENFRKVSKADRNSLLQMLKGQPLEDSADPATSSTQ